MNVSRNLSKLNSLITFHLEKGQRPKLVENIAKTVLVVVVDWCPSLAKNTRWNISTLKTLILSI